MLVVSSHAFYTACREKTSTALFFKYNSQLGPPYQVLVDTNFINFSIKNKVSISHHHVGVSLQVLLLQAPCCQKARPLQFD